MSLDRLIKRLGDSFCATPQQSDASPEMIPLATAAILLEIAHADSTFSDVEKENVTGFLKRAFTLSDQVAGELIAAAEETRRRSIDHWSLTNLVRKGSSLEQRIEIVKTMWRIVYADGFLDAHEDHLVRKLADLLGLERHVMIEAKLKVREERGLSPA